MSKKMARICLIFVGVLSIFFAFFAKDVVLDYSVEGFFSKENKETDKAFEKTFENKTDFILLSVTNPDGVYDSVFLRTVKNLGDDLKEVSQIQSVFSPVHNCYYLKQAGIAGIEKFPCLTLDQPEKPDSNLINGKFLERLVSEDEKTLCLYLTHDISLNKSEGDSLKTDFFKVLSEYEIDYHVAGTLLSQIEYVSLMERELVKFLAIAMVILVTFLTYTYRSVSGVLIPLLAVLISLLWSAGVMGIAGKDVDLLMTMLPTIVFIIGLSDIIHFFNKYLIEVKTKSVTAAIRISFKEVGLATFLTSFTTAFGFFTLVVTNVELVQGFGLFSGISIIITFVVTFLVIPPLITLFPNVFKAKRAESPLEKWLPGLYLIILKKRKLTLVLSIIVVIACSWFISRLESNNFLLEDLEDDNPVKQEVQFFENNFHGIRAFFLQVSVKDSTKDIYSFEVMQQLDSIQRYIKNSYAGGVANTASIVDVYKMAYAIKHNNKSRYYKLPGRERSYRALRKNISEFTSDETSLKKLVSKNQMSANIFGNVGDFGGKFFRAENEKLKAYYTNNIDTNLIGIQVMGKPHLLDKEHESISSSVLWGLLASIGVISMVVIIIFKSIRIAIISLVPNVLPLFITAGMMGLMGVELKISTVIIFSLAFGIAVDDTIHILSKYKIELGKGRHPFYAIKRSVLSTGKAVITTSAILSGGFVALLFSDFVSIKYMGLLVGMTLTTAVIVDLFLLPNLLIWFGPKKAK